MKLNITIVVSFLSSLFALLGFTCNALPIWANFAREYQGDHAISPPPQPTSTFDIYGKELLSADGKAFPSSLAYYTESSLKQPFSSSSGFLLLPNSVTASSLPDSPSRQTVFIDINGSVVKMDEPSQGSFLSRSATRSTSWVRALRKRDEGETFEPQIVPSKFERLGGAAKLTISPAPSLHYNQMSEWNHRSNVEAYLLILSSSRWSFKGEKSSLCQGSRGRRGARSHYPSHRSQGGQRQGARRAASH